MAMDGGPQWVVVTDKHPGSAKSRKIRYVCKQEGVTCIKFQILFRSKPGNSGIFSLDAGQIMLSQTNIRRTCLAQKSTGFILAGIIAGGAMAANANDAQAIKSGACVARDQLNATLAAENQTKVVGGMQPAVVTIAGQRKLSVIKVIFTSSADRKTGWLLKQDGCTPPNGDPADATAWRFYMPMRNPKVFDNPTADVPVEARPNYNFENAIAECKQIKPSGSRELAGYEDAEVTRTRNVSEALQKHIFVPVSNCTDFDTALSTSSEFGGKVMYQASTVLADGSQGPLLTLAGKTVGKFAEILLTTNSGATVRPEGLTANFYIDGYKEFKVLDKIFINRP